MTREEIIRMAREAGFHCYNGCVDGIDADLERFFQAAYAAGAAAEREACAKECENHKVGLNSYFEIDERIQECAAAIRARGQS